MTDWTHDGTPLQAGSRPADVGLTGQRAHYSILGLREMVVVARYYVDDPKNRSKRFVEYSCRDLQTNEVYPGCRQMSLMGGVSSGDDNTLTPSTNWLAGRTGTDGKINTEQAAARDTNGDQVLVGFIEGSHSRPVIIGLFRHSASDYGATEKQGERRLTLHKGTSVEFRADGSWNLKQKSGSSITIDPEGNVTVDAKAGATVRLSDGSSLTDVDGVLTGRSIDSFTGSTQFALGNASSTVLAKK